MSSNRFHGAQKYKNHARLQERSLGIIIKKCLQNIFCREGRAFAGVSLAKLSEETVSITMVVDWPVEESEKVSMGVSKASF